MLRGNLTQFMHVTSLHRTNCRIATLVAGAATLVALAGCTGEKTVVGTWYVANDSPDPAVSIISQVTYHKDGRYESVSEWDVGEGVKLVTKDKGTWVYKDNKLKVNYQDVVWETPGAEGERHENIVRNLQKGKAEMLKKLNEEPPALVLWSGPNMMELQSPDGSIRARRK